VLAAEGCDTSCIEADGSSDIRALLRIEFPRQFLDLRFQCIVFGLLPAQKTRRQAGFSGYSGGREEVSILKLVWRHSEVLDLDLALLDQCLNAIVELAQADPHFSRELSLRDLWVLLDQAQDPEFDIVVIVGHFVRELCPSTETKLPHAG